MPLYTSYPQSRRTIQQIKNATNINGMETTGGGAAGKQSTGGGAAARRLRTDGGAAGTMLTSGLTQIC